TYHAGTTTRKATYNSAAGDIPNTNPVILDSAGRAVIFGVGSYRIVVHDADDNHIRTVDPVYTPFFLGDVSTESMFETLPGDGSESEFTLSSDFGTEASALMIFIRDPGGDDVFEIISPQDYTIEGDKLTFLTAPPAGTSNIYVFAP